MSMRENDEIITMLEESAQRFLQDLQGSSGIDLWPRMAEQGWLALALPESHGGAGLGLSVAASLIRLFGQHAVANDFIAQAVMPGSILAKVSPQQPMLEALCEGLVSGECRITLAWQEEIDQLVPGLPNTHFSDGVLNGQKCFVPAATSASHFLVTAVAAGEMVIVLVDRDADGLTMRSQSADADVVSLQFSNTPVSEESVWLRGIEAERALQSSLQWGRVAVAAELEGLASGCLQKTLEYIKTRMQFNKAIGSFQAIRHRCADLLIDIQLAEHSWRNAATLFELNDGDTQCASSAAKSRCADVAFKVAKESVQMHGAMGFTEEAGIGSYMRSSIRLGAWLGSTQQHRRLMIQSELSKGSSHE